MRRERRIRVERRRGRIVALTVDGEVEATARAAKFEEPPEVMDAILAEREEESGAEEARREALRDFETIPGEDLDPGLPRLTTGSESKVILTI